MPMVDIRVVRVRMLDLLMPMGVRVRFARRIIGTVFVLMMFPKRSDIQDQT